jgi:predicted ATPase
MKTFSEILSEKLNPTPQVDNSLFPSVPFFKNPYTETIISPTDMSFVLFTHKNSTTHYKKEAFKNFLSKERTRSYKEAHADEAQQNQKSSNSNTDSKDNQSIPKSKASSKVQNTETDVQKVKLTNLSFAQKKALKVLNIISGNELTTDFSQIELKKVYKKLVFKLHPDRLRDHNKKETPSGASFEFYQTIQAYKTLNVLFQRD